ncbi:MAG: hypothetical protein HPY66_3038 [Firmicutes bacterium]|nr:hypothetical protein [Bacillota bacterium]
MVVGQNLLVPTPEDGVIFRYVVQPGDTLFSISRLFNVSVESIAVASGLSTPYTIFPGQILNIPLRNLRQYTVRRISLTRTSRDGCTRYGLRMYGATTKNMPLQGNSG